MTEEAAALSPAAPPPRRARIRAGLRHRGNWLQLVRFSAVGASGYVVNLAVFAALVHGLGVRPVLAALGAFAVAVTNNFLVNRRWTFRAHGDPAAPQAARFLAVSLLGLGWNLAALAGLVALGLAPVLAQAIAIATATPLTFLGNRLWTFGA